VISPISYQGEQLSREIKRTMEDIRDLAYRPGEPPLVIESRVEGTRRIHEVRRADGTTVLRAVVELFP
jgi:hypothetical protein